MARCVGSTICNCAVVGGEGITVTGAGTPQRPYVIDSQTKGGFATRDTATIRWGAITGSGTSDDPYILSANAQLATTDLTNVSNAQPQNGQVLAWNGAEWAPAPPSVAPVGAVHTDNCIEGDGSSGNPVRLQLDASPTLSLIHI